MELYREMNSWGHVKNPSNIYEILKTEWKSGRTGETSLIKNIVTGDTRELNSEALVSVPTEEARELLRAMHAKQATELGNLTKTIAAFEEKHGY